jgi:hypothetical protein
VEKWQDVVFVGVAHLRREATRAADPKLLELARRFDTAIEVTASEQRAERTYPADEESASCFNSCASPR